MGGDVSGSKKTKSEPNVVPLCDILLVLLIIFMVVTPMIKKGANVKLPEASNIGTEPESGKMVTVFIQKTGVVYVDDKIVDDMTKFIPMLEDRLEQIKQTDRAKILLKADVEIAYGRVTEVMEELRRASIETLGLVVIEKVSSE